MADGTITIATELDTKSFDKQIEAVEREIADLENQLSKSKELGFSSKDVDELNLKLEKAKNKLVQLNAQKNKLGNTVPVDNLGKSFENSIKKVGRLALAIFGIRSAYLAVRRASSDLANYDDQYATDLEYIRFVLTQAIAPILKFIVSLAMKLLQIINYIIQALFGVNLFEKGSVENFQKMKQNANGVSKAVKEIKKQLLGFDEVNILTSQTDTGTSAGAGGVGTPSLDLSGISGEPPEWLKWIIQDKNNILDVLAGIGTALLLIKFGLSGIKALGIGIMLVGIIKSIKAFIEYTKDPSWKNFGELIQWIGVAIAGLGLSIFGLPGLVAGAIITIMGLLIKNWEKIKEGLKNARDFIFNIANTIYEKGSFVGGLIFDFITGGVMNILRILGGLFDSVIGWFDNIFYSAKQIFDGILQIFKGDFVNGMITIGKGLVNILISIINFAINGINSILAPIRNLIVQAGNIAGKNWTMDTIRIPTIPMLAKGGIVNMPNKRCNAWRSNCRRSWSRGCNTFNRCRGYGNAWRSYRKTRCN